MFLPQNIRYIGNLTDDLVPRELYENKFLFSTLTFLSFFSRFHIFEQHIFYHFNSLPMGGSFSKDIYCRVTTRLCQTVVPIFGLPQHTAELFSEPAWHFTNPLNLPLFGYYLIAPEQQQIANTFNNNKLIEYSRVLEDLYVKNGLHRDGLPTLLAKDLNFTPSKKFADQYPVSCTLSPHFHFHVQEQQDNDTNDHLLITLPFPITSMSEYYSPHIFTPDTANVPLQHPIYTSETYQFPPYQKWDQYKYKFNQTPESSKHLQFFSKTPDRDFYTQFLPLQPNQMLMASWPMQGFKPNLFMNIGKMNQNFNFFNYIILIIDLGDVDSRKEFSNFVNQVVELRLKGFIFNITQLPLFLFLGQQQLDRQTEDSHLMETINDFPRNKKTGQYDFHTSPLTKFDLIKICQIIGFLEEKLIINEVNLSNPRFNHNVSSYDLFSLPDASIKTPSLLSIITSIIRPRIVSLHPPIHPSEPIFLNSRWIYRSECETSGLILPKIYKYPPLPPSTFHLFESSSKKPNTIYDLVDMIKLPPFVGVVEVSDKYSPTLGMFVKIFFISFIFCTSTQNDLILTHQLFSISFPI